MSRRALNLSETGDESCNFCGELVRVEVLDYFAEDRSFTLDTCCGELHEFAVTHLPNLSRKEFATWFESSCGVGVRQIITQETPTWCVDTGLSFCPVTWQEAKAFVSQHHRNNAAPQGWKFGHGLRSCGELVAVVTAGRPVAPNIDHRKVIEVTRLCVKDLFPRKLGWNACTMLYGWVFREAERKGYQKVVTYTHLHESGVSLRAAGFFEDGLTAGGSWHRANRPRPNAPEPSKKRRWIRDLIKSDAAPPRQLALFPKLQKECSDTYLERLAS
ncbi:XF1762 family protein [Edaphobacter modestus]|uniref:Uncharacterized protein n=1 Tax=Edaphobacter modestus TaxID=388466 RepID=A0A4Q7XYC1_9BACT|nr:XF1762 family protein [Edaphobacter modestus]RZU28924.1 hypothetical protein BDD14_6509 [Edaphobacter modestus]